MLYNSVWQNKHFHYKLPCHDKSCTHACVYVYVKTVFAQVTFYNCVCQTGQSGQPVLLRKCKKCGGFYHMQGYHIYY